MKHSITVLRLGHRPLRDKRVTTHVALVARAFGAKSMIITVTDPKLAEVIEKVCSQFGGDFFVGIEDNWRSFIKKWKEKGTVIHLTMYGEHIVDILPEIKKIKRDILVIVGAEKVPRNIYELADFNIAVGNQPHSEIAALAVFLDRLLDGQGLQQRFEGPMMIEPNPKGKTVKILDED
jgi:tRNA (cytidine56-2'-O)-methyltransferase